MISPQHSDAARHAPNTKTNLQNLRCTSGCYQRIHGVDYTWIMQSTSWGPTGQPIQSGILHSTYILLHPSTQHCSYVMCVCLEEFAHVFSVEEFRGIPSVLQGTPHDGAADRLVQTFKQALRRSQLDGLYTIMEGHQRQADTLQASC